MPAIDDSAASTRRIVLCGTDTAVGKTHVGVALVTELARRGLLVGVAKPIESGLDEVSTEQPSDARALAEAAGLDDLDVVCPWRLPRAVTPAAELERLGMNVTARALREALLRAGQGRDVLVIETAGGVLSPLTPSLASADLATLTDASTVLVTRSALGCISHTATAVEALVDRGARVEAIVLNNAGGPRDLYELNAEWIARSCPAIRLIRYDGDAAPLADALRLRARDDA
jgi:dethiobiotin synthetase